MTTGATNLYDLAHDLLDAVVDAYSQMGVASAVPGTRYVLAGTPVAECDRMVVSWNDVHVGIPGTSQTPEHTVTTTMRSAVFEVWIFRCLAAVPTGEGEELLDPPPVEAFDSDAGLILVDANVLHRGVVSAWRAGGLRSDLTSMSLGPCLPVEPSGEIGGCHMQITVELS